MIAPARSFWTHWKLSVSATASSFSAMFRYPTHAQTACMNGGRSSQKQVLRGAQDDSSCLRSRTRDSGDGKHCFVGEAEGTVDRAGRGSHFKPLVKRQILRVVDVAGSRAALPRSLRCIGQYLDGIADLQIPLALGGVRRLTRELPDRGRVVDKRIVDRTRRFRARAR